MPRGEKIGLPGWYFFFLQQKCPKAYSQIPFHGLPLFSVLFLQGRRLFSIERMDLSLDAKKAIGLGAGEKSWAFIRKKKRGDY